MTSYWTILFCTILRAREGENARTHVYTREESKIKGTLSALVI